MNTFVLMGTPNSFSRSSRFDIVILNLLSIEQDKSFNDGFRNSNLFRAFQYLVKKLIFCFLFAYRYPSNKKRGTWCYPERQHHVTAVFAYYGYFYLLLNKSVNQKTLYLGIS